MREDVASPQLHFLMELGDLYLQREDIKYQPVDNFVDNFVDRFILNICKI